MIRILTMSSCVDQQVPSAVASWTACYLWAALLKYRLETKRVPFRNLFVFVHLYI